MKTAYEPGSAVEAHMIQDFLKQEGIPAEVHGASLTGAVGELPAAGLVRVVVPEEDYERAREAIRRWEGNEETPASPAPAPEKSRSRFWPAIAGLVAGVMLGHTYSRVPLRADGYDHNADGKQDEFVKRTLSGNLREVEVDRNFDGTIDWVNHYDQSGEIITAEGDDDFDGRFETRMRYALGQAVAGEIDSDGDGIANERSTYQHDVLRKSELIDPYTGQPVRVEYYERAMLTHADEDSDGDGKLDRRLFYSPERRAIKSEPLR